MRSVRPWIALCLLASHVGLADDALEKNLAAATKQSSQKDIATYVAGDAKFAEIRELPDLSPEDRARTWLLQGTAASTRRDFPMAIVALKKAASTMPETAPPELRAEVHNRLAQVYYNQSRYSDSAAESTTALKLHPSDSGAVDYRAKALEQLGQYREAAEALAEFVKVNKEISPSEYAAVEGHRLRTLSTIKDWPAVITGVDAFIAATEANMNLSDVKLRVSEARRLKAAAQLASQDIASALATAKLAVESSFADSASLAAVFVDSESTDAIAGLITVLRQVQLAQWKSTSVYDHTQLQISRLYLAAGNVDAALWEARCMYLNGSAAQLATSAMGVATCLKARDGDLIRANQFLRFVRFGPAGEDSKPGTGDDLTDPTSGLQPVVPTEQASAIQALIDAAEDDWQVHIQVGRLYTAKGDLKSALTSYREAFAKSPGNQQDTQTAADALADFVGRLSRDELLVKDVMAFLMFGPDGPDGKPKSADDIADPATRLTSLLTPSKND